MDLLIFVIITGMAAAYTLELLTSLLGTFISPRIIKQFLTLPLAILGCWLFNVTGLTLAVASPAAAFVALAIMLFINRPVSVITQRR